EADADGLLPILHAELIDSGAMPVSEGEVFGPRWRQIIGSVRPLPYRFALQPSPRPPSIEMSPP
ncbi:hypothetical protein P1995_21340, partial [Xanthomonas perforans]